MLSGVQRDGWGNIMSASATRMTSESSLVVDLTRLYTRILLVYNSYLARHLGHQ